MSLFYLSYLVGEYSVEVVDQLGEGGPVGGVGGPALPHDVVHLRRAALRTLHPVPVPQQLHSQCSIVNQFINYNGLHIHLEELLDGGDGGVGVGAERHDLPEEDAERPDVRLRRVAPLEERLGRHPLDGEAAVACGAGGVAIQWTLKVAQWFLN